MTRYPREDEASRLLPKTKKKSATMKCCKWSERRVIVDILAILFGIGSWISINGLWVELPLLVETQPEGWNLPSYLSVIIQIANAGPILYSIAHGLFPKRIKEGPVIYFVLVIGCVASVLLASLWKETTFVLGSQRSTSLFCLVFFLSLVDCTSSVLFLPFMASFKEIYLLSFLIGEGLSGFLPSVVALIQGVGGNPECRNRTSPTVGTTVTPINPESSMELYTPPPLFSPDIFFVFLVAMMLLCSVAFFLLNNLRVAKKEKVNAPVHPLTKYVLDQDLSTSTSSGVHSNSSNSLDTSSESGQYNVEALESSVQALDSTKPYKEVKESDDTVRTKTRSYYPLTQSLYIYFLLLQAWICLLGNGVFPSVQSYSCLPYGNVAYHLSVTLGNMANPLACFIAFFIPCTSVVVITLMTLLGTGISFYLLATAVLSPTPPLVDTTEGEVLIVLACILFVGIISYAKVSIASIFRMEGRRALFWCGAITQAGSAIGSIATFFAVNYSDYFVSYTVKCP